MSSVFSCAFILAFKFVAASEYIQHQNLEPNTFNLKV